MQKLLLDTNAVLYTFPDQPMHISILALVHEDRALLVDTGFVPQAESVKADLLAQGITVQFVFNSHYNGDHIAGNSVFQNVDFLGNEKYAFHLDRFCELYPDTVRVEPTVKLKGGERMSFGDFDLQFLHLPGHTDCSMALLINCSTLHVGDNLVRLLDGTDLIPYHMHPDSRIDDFIRSLQQILKLRPKQVVLSHAGVIRGEEDVQKAIKSRIKYMCKLQEKGRSAALEDCLSDDLKSNDTNRQWHENNIRVLFDK